MNILRVAGILLLAVFFSAGAVRAQPASQPTDTFAMILSAGMAPCTIHVHALNLPLAHGTVLTARYDWDFGDEAGRYNKLTGWNAAHIYNRAGQYTITLTLTDETGARQVLHRTITISPDARRSVYVASNGNDASSGADPAQPVRSFARASKLIGRDTKILFRSGDVFEISAAMSVSKANVIIGSYSESVAPPAPTTSPADAPPGVETIATDRRPVIRWVGPRQYASMIRIETPASDIIVQDLTFDSNFTSDTEMKNMPDSVKASGVNATVRNCRFLNVGYGINANGKPRGMLMQECDAPLDTGVRGVGAWCEGSDLVFLGNYMINSTRAHTLRVGGADRLLIAHNNLSNIDRRPKGDTLDWNNGAMTIHEGSYVYVTDNVVGAGLVLVGPLGAGDGLRDISRRWHYAVIERNRIGSWVQVIHGTDHVMIRNNIIRRNDWSAIEVEGYNETYHRGCADITIANNTAVNIGARGYFLRVTGPVDGITLANNLYVAPKLPGGTSNAAAVWVNQSDLSSFKSIVSNLWPACGGGAVNFVNNAGVTPAQWLAMPPVSDDRFRNILLDEHNQPVTDAGNLPSAKPIPGVWDDLNGLARSSLTVGAVQMK
jgi:PKD repeat protein